MSSGRHSPVTSSSSCDRSRAQQMRLGHRPADGGARPTCPPGRGIRAGSTGATGRSGPSRRWATPSPLGRRPAPPALRNARASRTRSSASRALTIAVAPARTASRLASVAAKNPAHSPNSGATSASIRQALRGDRAARARPAWSGPPRWSRPPAGRRGERRGSAHWAVRPARPRRWPSGPAAGRRATSRTAARAGTPFGLITAHGDETSSASAVRTGVDPSWRPRCGGGRGPSAPRQAGSACREHALLRTARSADPSPSVL